MIDTLAVGADAPARRTRVRGLYAVTPDLADTALLVALVEAALRGGASLLQYRNKTASPGLRREQAIALAACCAAHGRPFVVNDHFDLALSIDHAGLHVGREDAAPDALHDLRDRLGPSRLLGVSCYRSVDAARVASEAGGDYVAFGSMFPSSTKATAPAAPATLFAEARALDVPLVGIGGITHRNLPGLIEAGCDAAAIIADLFASLDPDGVETSARRLSSCFACIRSKNSLMTASRNDQLFARALRTTPGGVNSPVRAFRQVGGTPRFVSRAEGPCFWDADGKRYIDYIGSWGPAILGHAHPAVVQAVQQAASRGLSFGAPTEGEIEMAEALCRLVPSMERVRLVSSGTEAAMSAIRLARGATGRPKIIKFDGCYHGHADSLLVKAGSGMLTFNTPSSAGVPPEITMHTIVLDYNDCDQLEAAFTEHRDTIACVIVEPIAGNMNLVRATPEFIATMQSLCRNYGALMIFDEVMSGFRVALGGAQALFDVVPDITVLGKVIGGGLPVAAFGGRADVMGHLSPEGAVYQAGTLSGNPVAVACGLATLAEVSRPGFYDRLSASTATLAAGLRDAASAVGIALTSDSVGGMFGFYFTDRLPRALADVTSSDIERFKRFFHAMLDRGIYLAPSAYEAGFVSSAHDAAVIDETLRSAREAFAAIG